MRLEKEVIKSKIYSKYGWKLSYWAKKRGFSPWQIYDYLRGRCGVKTAKRITDALKQDGIINEMPEVRGKDVSVCCDISKSANDRTCMSELRTAGV
jgi:hypothetical protein